MNDLFLHRAAPLYGRARKLLHVQPMDYFAFCDACGLRPVDPDSFEKFACVGGIPKYWEFVEAGGKMPWRSTRAFLASDRQRTDHPGSSCKNRA